jgi:hypothetical protein
MPGALVAFHDAGILASEVESLLRPAEDQVERLRFEGVEGRHQPRSVPRAPALGIEAVEPHVSRHACGRVVRAADARSNGTDRRFDRRLAVVRRWVVDAGHDEMRRAGVARVAVREGPNERHAVRALRDFRQQPADLDAREGRLDRPDHTAKLARRFHLRVERLDVRSAAAEPQPDDRCVLGPRAAARSHRPGSQEA